MAALDSNHDGELSAADAKFSELKLWVDANHDGITDTGELKALADMGVLEINLDFTKTTTTNNGNLLGMVSNWTGTDGSSHQVADVWFAKAPAADSAVPTVGELLAGPPADLLPPGPVAAASPAAQAHTTAERPAPEAVLSLLPSHPRPWEEEQRQMPLI
jgi:hypothetical protein